MTLGLTTFFRQAARKGFFQARANDLTLSPFLAWIRSWTEHDPQGAGEEPLPLEIFSLEQLEAHAGRLAATHTVRDRGGVDKLLPRLRDNERYIREACETLGAAQESLPRNSPAGDWLLDNVHVIGEQISITRRHLPRGYSRALPHLTSGPFVGFPRVYHLAIAMIAHVDGRIDRENVSRFLAAYQAPLLPREEEKVARSAGRGGRAGPPPLLPREEEKVARSAG